MAIGRLAGLAGGWGSGHGPQALLACPPGELHDMALMVSGIVLHRNGWRIGYLGAGTPVKELERAVDSSHPDWRDTLGRKYPWALGRPANEVWTEIATVVTRD